MEDAKKVIEEVTKNITKKSSSRKDEITVMKAMLNDPEFSVDVYNGENGEEIEKYYPGRDIRKVVSNAVSSISKIPHKEADELVSLYEFSKADAASVVDFSKEYLYEYLNTGRKLGIGPRVSSNVELVWKHIPDRTVKVPQGNNRADVFIPAHDGIGAINTCPKWISKDKK